MNAKARLQGVEAGAGFGRRGSGRLQGMLQTQIERSTAGLRSAAGVSSSTAPPLPPADATLRCQSHPPGTKTPSDVPSGCVSPCRVCQHNEAHYTGMLKSRAVSGVSLNQVKLRISSRQTCEVRSKVLKRWIKRTFWGCFHRMLSPI